jgi:hypothetical protein
MNRRYWVTIHRGDYAKADPIMSKMYEEGDIDSIWEEWSGNEISLGVQCTSDDLMIMQKRFEENGIKFR